MDAARYDADQTPGWLMTLPMARQGRCVDSAQGWPWAIQRLEPRSKPNRTTVADRAAEEGAMISIEDCIGLCGLDRDTIGAIAEHEHVPEIVATGIAQYLLGSDHGSERIRDIIIDDVRAAQERGDRAHVQHLLHVLHHFLRTCPEALPEAWRRRPG
jgi:hypothetical protein